MNDTPRTNAVKFTVFLGKDNYGRPQVAEVVMADHAMQLERELNEAKTELTKLKLEVNHNWQATDDLEASLAREAQLRAAVELAISREYGLIGDTDDPATKEQRETIGYWDKALTLPAPPVVPVEDVKPLVEALKNIEPSDPDVSWWQEARSALSTFTAKHAL